MGQQGSDGTPRSPHGTDPLYGASANVPGEFSCPGCGHPLDIVLHSTMCFAEAQVSCPDCERDYRRRRGQSGTRDTPEAQPPLMPITGDTAC
jgi:hypothetical protein